MHQFKTYPPVVVEASIGDAIGITRKKGFWFGRVQRELAVHRLASKSSGPGFAGTVDLRTIPPGGILVTVSRVFLVHLIQRFVCLSTSDFHLRIRPRVALEKGYFHIFLGFVVMRKPVVYLKLDPGSSQKIHDSRRLELTRLTSEQTLTDQSRIRIEEFVMIWRCGILPWYISTESHPSATHTWLFDIVEFAIRFSGTEVSRIGQRLCCLSSLK